MSRPLLVVIGYVWPEPNSSAAGSRILQIIDFFRLHDWRIIFASAAALSEHRFDLISLNIEEKIIALNDSSFDDWIETSNPTVVIFDRFFTEEQFGWRVERSCPNALRVLDTEDFHGLRKVRQAMLKGNIPVINAQLKNNSSQDMGVVQASSKTLFNAMIDDESVQRELASVFRCDLNLIISTYEIQLLRNYFGVPQSQLLYLPLLVESELVEANELVDKRKLNLFSFSQRKDFVVLGNFRHEPNWDSVQLLKYWIWPALRKKLSAAGMAADLIVCGAYPPPKATELHNPKEGFLVKGWVPDALDILKQARVCLAPLRFGAGQKGKLLHAMQTGTPSVTTSIGAESMCEDLLCNDLQENNNIKNNWSGAVENNLDGFVNAAFELYSLESKWLDAQRRGFKLLRDHFSSKSFADEFWNLLMNLLSNIEIHRKNNVVGTLLRHQQHRASQYMSQWIEEKNKRKNGAEN